MPLLVTGTQHGWRTLLYQQRRAQLSVGGYGLVIEDDSWARTRGPAWGPGRPGETDVAVLDPLAGMRALLAMVHDARSFAIARTACQNLGVVLSCETLGHTAVGGGDLLDVLGQKPLDAVFTRPSISQLQALTEGIGRQRRAGYAREVVLMGSSEMRDHTGVIQPTLTADWPTGDVIQQVKGLEEMLRPAVMRLFGQAPDVIRLKADWPGPVYLRAQAMMAAAYAWAQLESGRDATQVCLYDLEPGAVTVYTVHNGCGFRAAYDVWGNHSLGLAKTPPDGVLPPAAGLVHCPSGDAIMRWLPFSVRPEDLANEVANYLTRPYTVPETWRELLIRMAVARAIFGRAMHIAGANRPEGIGFGRPRLMVVTGGLVAGGHESVTLWFILDLAQPVGITPIHLDQAGLLPGLGALALGGHLVEGQEPAADAPVPLLTTSIAPLSRRAPGKNRRDHVAAMVSMDVPGEKPTVLRLYAGGLTRLPLTAGRKVKIRLEPASGYDFGAGSGRVWEGEVAGGRLGLVFDTRERPLVLPLHEDTRISLLRGWLAEVRRARP